MNQTIETILNRKSVRQFADKPVDKELVDLILKSGMSAPSARNRQPWKFLVIDEKELKSTLAEQLPYAKMLKDAALGIVVCGDIRDKEDLTAQDFWVQDCAAAVENILLACESLGLGAVWTACYPKKDRVNTVIQNCNLPEGIIPLCVIPIGYPLSENNPINKWTEENVIHNRF